MLRFKRNQYSTPNAVSTRAKYFRDLGLTWKAEELLKASLKEWPDNIFLYNQLLTCITDPVIAWHLFKKIRKSRAIPDAFTYRTLIGIFQAASQLKDITERLDPMMLPTDALPAYCEALRKTKQYEKCIWWCNVAIPHIKSTETLEHIWINRLYCYLHLDGNKFIEDIQESIISPRSQYYHRLVAAKIYGGVYDDAEIPAMKKTLTRAIMDSKNENLKPDLIHALNLLS